MRQFAIGLNLDEKDISALDFYFSESEQETTESDDDVSLFIQRFITEKLEEIVMDYEFIAGKDEEVKHVV